MTMSPAFAGPMLLAVMEAPLFRVTNWPAEIVMAPPVALEAVPDVEAEIVPPFWMLRDCAAILVLPPGPVPWVLAKTPLPAPSITTDPAGPARPWMVIIPPAPEGITGG